MFSACPSPVFTLIAPFLVCKVFPGARRLPFLGRPPNVPFFGRPLARTHLGSIAHQSSSCCCGWTDVSVLHSYSPLACTPEHQESGMSVCPQHAWQTRLQFAQQSFNRPVRWVFAGCCQQKYTHAQFCEHACGLVGMRLSPKLGAGSCRAHTMPSMYEHDKNRRPFSLASSIARSAWDTRALARVPRARTQRNWMPSTRKRR